MSGYWLLEYLGAAQRQKALVDARMTYAANELGYCPAQRDPDDPVERTVGRQGYGVGAMETRLGWGRGRAGSFDSLGYALREEFTHTWAMLHAGVIDLEVARAITDGAGCLPDPANQATVETRVLSWIRKQRRVPAAQVRKKVAKEVVIVDPEGAKLRHEQQVRSRGCSG